MLISTLKEIVLATNYALKYFPGTSQESRAKLEAATAGWHREFYPVNDLTTDQALYMNVYMKHPKGKRDTLILKIHGTHGLPEERLGVAKTLSSLEYLLELNDDVGFAIISPYNPYGYSHGQRWDEDGVDLNRAQIDDPNGFPDFQHPHQIKNLLERLQPVIDAKAPLGNRLKELWQYYSQVFKLIKNGELEPAIRVVACGQWSDPSGVFYGGTETPKQAEIMREVIPHLTEGYRQAIVIDEHTGLGKGFRFLPFLPGFLLGRPSYLTNLSSDDPRFLKLKNAFPYLQSTSQQEIGSSRSQYPVKGSLLAYIEKYSKAQATYPIVIDDYTAFIPRVFFALRQQKRAITNPETPARKARKADKRVLRRFGPANPIQRALSIHTARKDLGTLIKEFNLGKKTY